MRKIEFMETKPGDLRKQASATAYRRQFGIAPPKIATKLEPVTMMPPVDDAPFKKFTLNSGVTYSPNFRRGGEVVVAIEADAVELEHEGWSRATSR